MAASLDSTVEKNMDEPMDIDQSPRQSVIPLPRSSIRGASVPPTSNVKDTSNRTAYVYDARMMNHSHSAEDHPERPERIWDIYHLLQSEGVIRRMIPILPIPVQRHRAILVHSESHWDKVEAITRVLNRISDKILSNRTKIL